MRHPSAEDVHSHSSLEFNSWSVKQEDACSHLGPNASQISGLDRATGRRERLRAPLSRLHTQSTASREQWAAVMCSS